MERWLPLSTYPQYEVSDLGRVRKSSRLITTYMEVKPNRPDNCYMCFVVFQDHRRKLLRLHREVAKLFLYRSLDYSAVTHIDGNRTNNKASNLRWVIGPYAKLLPSQVRQLKVLRKEGWSHRRIAKFLKVTTGSICHHLKVV